MKVIHNLRMDLARCGCRPVVAAVQGEANTRVLAVSLYDNGVAWEPAEGVTAAVAFKKPDGACGLYDKLPNGDEATTISGSEVTAILAPQALTVPGDVMASIVFFDQALNRLATFPFRIRVEVDPAGGQYISDNYYKYSTMEEVNAVVEAALASMEAAKQELLSVSTSGVLCDLSGETITAADSSDRPLSGLTVYGKTTQSSTPSPESPVPLESVGDNGSVTVSVGSKNFFGGDALADKLVEVANATKNVAAGTVTYFREGINGKVLFDNFKPDTQYTFILYGSVDTSSYANLRLYYADGTSEAVRFESGKEDIPHYAKLLRSSSRYLYSAAGKTITKLVGYNQSGYVTLYYDECGIFEGVLTESDFEPYIEPQTLTMQTPNGLLGVPVSVGGNYTDESGQQWYCDEVDYTRGVYVKRIHRVEINSTSSKTTITVRTNSVRLVYPGNPNALPSNPYAQYCDRLTCGKAYGQDIVSFVAAVDNTGSLIVSLPLSAGSTKEAVGNYLAEHPLDIMYPLETPIETPLSAEELAQYAALHTNRPNTTISNDAGAHMGVSYWADTKAYIDNKIAALSSAMLNA